MLTWQEFCESKKMEKEDIEKEEEKFHKDLDHDNEEGESEEHKEKVFGFLPKKHIADKKNKKK